MAIARDQKGRGTEVIAVIGVDEAISAGMAYEAINNAEADLKSKLIVILNDNDMSIAHTKPGAMRAYFSRLISGKAYNSFP